jgi:large subunit ribosomal protein LP0
MVVSKVLQDGSLFDAKVLDLSTDSILAKFRAAAGVQASLSLGAGFPTAASAPHSLLNGFKNLVAASAASGYSFPQATALLEAAKNAPAAGAATSGGAQAAAPVEEEVKKEETEVVEMGNLFGGDDDEY